MVKLHDLAAERVSLAQLYGAYGPSDRVGKVKRR
jgi:hypothetical protein